MMPPGVHFILIFGELKEPPLTLGVFFLLKIISFFSKIILCFDK